MTISNNVRRAGVLCTAIGFSMMSFALFLHPMSPGDFAASALSSPLASLQTSYGIQATILFWISLALLGAGQAALAATCSPLRRLVQWISGLRRRGRADDIENVEDLWSYM